MIFIVMIAFIKLLQDQRGWQGMNNNGIGRPNPTTSYISNILQIVNILQHNIGIIIKELLSIIKYQTRKLVAESSSYLSEDVVQP
jgi:hypothetical protein